MVIEARSPEQDHLDRGLLTGLRLARVVPKGLAVTWQTSVMDGQPACYETLASKARLICVG
ncbi:hypothetical protein [Nonomuraea sp. NPDC023979]|uniref:hypothetical protein n=1 Tax=Nonomuraea sp. NPDC023979 TaxID=3154796 RepID=UPI00340A5BB5